MMGLPSKRVLTSHRYPVPTAVYPNGKMVRLTARSSKTSGKGGKGGSGGSSNGPAASPGLVTFAGTGFFGIRPGAWLLTVTDNEVGWGRMAHSSRAPGAYASSAAGHSRETGDIGPVIGVLGDPTSGTPAPVPVLLDFGKYCHS